MIPSVSTSPRTLLNDCNHCATAMLWRLAIFFRTGAGTLSFQNASKGRQFRVKRRVLDHIRPPFTLQSFQCNIETISAFQTAALLCTRPVQEYTAPTTRLAATPRHRHCSYIAYAGFFPALGGDA